MKTSIAKLISLSIGRPVIGLAVFFLSLPAQAQQFVPQLLPQPARIEIRKGEYLKLKHPADSAWMRDLSYSYDTALPPEGYVVDVTGKGISIRPAMHRACAMPGRPFASWPLTAVCRSVISRMRPAMRGAAA